MSNLQAISRPAPLTLTSGQLTHVIDEYELQVGVMQAQGTKSVYAYRLIHDLWMHNVATAEQAMRWMEMLDQTAVFEGRVGLAWSQFLDASIERFLDTMLKADVMSSKNILIELERTLYLQRIQPKRRGVVVQLFDALFSRGAP